MSIFYKNGYKYQLVKDYSVQVGMLPVLGASSEYIDLSSSGVLTIKRGYAWDGPSGPTVDTRNFMRGSLVHDALYQLMREGMLDISWREQADKELQRICREDGMSWLRAQWVYQGVRWGAGFAADPMNRKPVMEAGR